MTDLEQQVLTAAIAYVRGDDAYHAAAADYRKRTGDDGLVHRTPAEEEDWRTRVVPVMRTSWALRDAFMTLVRDLDKARLGEIWALTSEIGKVVVK